MKTPTKQIAVALKGGSLSAHFGHADSFAIFRTSGTECGVPVYRVRHSPCGGGHSHEASSPHGHPAHRSLLEILDGCEIVLCGGIRAGAAEALAAAGITPLSVEATGSPEELCAKYLLGELPFSPARGCRAEAHWH